MHYLIFVTPEIHKKPAGQANQLVSRQVDESVRLENQEDSYWVN
jgi:hypothetical protein